MPYATAAELAAALRVRVTAENQDLLDACLSAAAEEVDSYLDRGSTPLPDPVPASVSRCNVNRAVEWFKASDLFNGSVGTDQTGVLTPPPGDGFARHGLSIRPFQLRWGIA